MESCLVRTTWAPNRFPSDQPNIGFFTCRGVPGAVGIWLPSARRQEVVAAVAAVVAGESSFLGGKWLVEQPAAAAADRPGCNPREECHSRS